MELFHHLPGGWEEKEYSNSKKPLEDFFTHDMEHFVLSEIVSTVIKGVDEKVDESEDVIDSHGCYFSKADSIKMYYV